MKRDVHGFRKRLENVKTKIQNPENSDWINLTEQNRSKLLEYYNYLQGLGTSEGRILKYLYSLKTIGKILNKDFESADRKDIERVLAQIRIMENPKTKKRISANTNKDFKVILKVFYRWLRNYPNKSYPPEVDWYSCTLKRNEEIEKEIIQHEDIIKLIESIPDVKFRAFYSLIYETAMRPEECLSLVWADVKDIEKGKMITCHGKTGARVLYSFWSAKYLIAYMNQHPNNLAAKQNPNMHLWIGRNTGIEIMPLSYSTVNQFFKKLVQKNKIQLKLEPSLYILRRSRLTQLLKTFPEGLVKLIAGHTKSSNTLGKYYNALTTTDVYDALATQHGIKVKKTIMVEKIEIDKCPVCSSQVTQDQNYCVSCLTPLKKDSAIKQKEIQNQFDEFLRNPIYQEKLMEFLKELHSKKGNQK